MMTLLLAQLVYDHYVGRKGRQAEIFGPPDPQPLGRRYAVGVLPAPDKPGQEIETPRDMLIVDAEAVLADWTKRYWEGG